MNSSSVQPSTGLPGTPKYEPSTSHLADQGPRISSVTQQDNGSSSLSCAGHRASPFFSTCTRSKKPWNWNHRRSWPTTSTPKRRTELSIASLDVLQHISSNVNTQKHTPSIQLRLMVVDGACGVIQHCFFLGIKIINHPLGFFLDA